MSKPNEPFIIDYPVQRFSERYDPEMYQKITATMKELIKKHNIKIVLPKGPSVPPTDNVFGERP